MRSSGFHREVRRNNDLLRNRDSWQAMLDYRVELERAGSHNFTSTLSRSSGSSAAVIGDVEWFLPFHAHRKKDLSSLTVLIYWEYSVCQKCRRCSLTSFVGFRLIIFRFYIRLELRNLSAVCVIDRLCREAVIVNTCGRFVFPVLVTANIERYCTAGLRHSLRGMTSSATSIECLPESHRKQAPWEIINFTHYYKLFACCD